MSSHLPELSPTENAELTSWLEQFSLNWQRDSIDQTGPKLQAFSHSTRNVVILELLKIDLQLAWENGIPRKVSAYQPLLEAVGFDDEIPPDLIFSEFLARYRNGEKPSASEYKKRFPQQYAEFRRLFLDEKTKRQSGNLSTQEDNTDAKSNNKDSAKAVNEIEIASGQESPEINVSDPSQKRGSGNPNSNFQIKEQQKVRGKRKSYRKKNKGVGVIIGLLLGGLTTIPLGLALLWIIDKQDPLGIFSQFAPESLAEQTEDEAKKGKSQEANPVADKNKDGQRRSKKQSALGAADAIKPSDDTRLQMAPKAFLDSANRARKALVEKDFENFAKIISTIEESNPSPEQTAMLQRLALVGEYYKNYREQVIKKCGLLKSGEEFTWSNGERISIVDGSETKLVYRRGGQRIQESPPELQDGLALKVLEHNENSYDTDILLLRGSVFAVRSFIEPEYQVRARKTWELVDSDASKDLLQHLQDSYGTLEALTLTNAESKRPEGPIQFNSVGYKQKHPVPLPKQLAVAKTAIDSAFQERLDSAMKMKDRQAKLQTLNLLAIGIQDAIKDEDDIINTYAIFDKAIEVAKVSCHSETTLNLVDQFSEQFAVDELQLRLGLFEYWQSKIPDYFQGADRYEKFRALAILAQPFAEQSESSYRWQMASDYFELLEKLARACNEKEETQTFRKRAGQCQVLAKKEIKINQLMIDLESNPAEPEAIHSEIGEFFCFDIGDWKTGLPYLAKSDDPTLSRIATLDLQHDATTASSTGDTWWEAAEDRKYRRWETRFRKRAGELYKEALPNLKGLEKLKIRERLDSLKS